MLDDSERAVTLADGVIEQTPPPRRPRTPLPGVAECREYERLAEADGDGEPRCCLHSFLARQRHLRQMAERAKQATEWQQAMVAAESNDPQYDFARNKNTDQPLPTVANMLIGLAKLKQVAEYDDFTDQVMLNGEKRTDAHVNQIWAQLSVQWGLKVSREDLRVAIEVEARKRTYHPVRDRLAKLKWDGVPRLDRVLIRYFGAADTELNRAIGRCVLIAACRRVFIPGTKFDTVLVLEGEQGSGKSKAIAMLALDGEWYTDALHLAASQREEMEIVAGKWIVEIPEMSGLSRAEVNAVKAMMSRGTDRSRLAYRRDPEDRPRQCIFIASTNSDTYLRDMTGGRRFWPVKTGTINHDLLRRDIEQLWAEAAHREALAESIVLPRHLWSVAAAEQEQRLEIDPFEESLQPLLQGLHDAKLRVADVRLALGIENPTPAEQTRMGTVMRRLSWKRCNCRLEGTQQRVYLKGRGHELVGIERCAGGAPTLRRSSAAVPCD